MTSTNPKSPPAGSVIELMRTGQRTPIATASVSRTAGATLVVDAPPAFDVEGLTLRWWDANDEAWETFATVGHVESSPTELLLDAAEPWRRAVLRRAERVETDRVPIELIMLGTDGHVTRRLRVSCLDLSALGCRIAGAGRPPSGADPLQVEADRPGIVACIDARVVHATPHAFGGWLAGIEFLPQDTADRAALIAWRDTIIDRANARLS
jgi:hypothetical protein